MKKEKYCIKCGAVLPEEASFCPCCTASQMERRSVVAPPPNGGRKHRRVWLCAALALLLAGAGIWAAAEPSDMIRLCRIPSSRTAWRVR